jgi:sugar lactone lactonase YvrE
MAGSVQRLVAAVVLAAALVGGAQAASTKFPERIALPKGFQPEGIAVAPNGTFYVGSIPTGAIYRGTVEKGKGRILVPGGNGRVAIGVEYEAAHERLFVAGGPSGRAFVYDAVTGSELRRYQLTTASTFVNDVVVTSSAAWFTDSLNQVLYRIPIGANGALGSAQTVPITGDLVYTSGFNANGIEASPDGNTLIVVQSNAGRLFRVTTSGVSTQIDIGSESVPNGDGLLLDGRTLYVVQNRLNRVAVIALAADLGSGRLVTRLTDKDFDVPTTIDDFGRRLYAVNARFGTTPTPKTKYWITQLRKP